MYSKRPAEFGETPIKIVFDGVGPDVDPAALNALYVANLGTISAFQAKARQSRLISDQPSSSMNMALPDGQQLRYFSNGGQETIHVKLTPEQIAAALTARRVPPDQPCDILLVIDVLFTPQQFLAGDIYSHQPTQSASDDYRTWTQLSINPTPDSIVQAYFPRGNIAYGIKPANQDPKTVYDGTQTLDSTSNAGVLYGNDPQIDGAIRSYVGRPVNYQGEFQYDMSHAGLTVSASVQSGSYGTDDFGFTRLKGMLNGSPVGATWAVVYHEYDTTFHYPQGPHFGDYDTSLNSLGGVEFYVRPGDVTKVTHEARTYLDILPVVGVRIASKDANKPDLTALSIGSHQDETDGLRAVTGSPDQTVARAIALNDPNGAAHFYGASFTVHAHLLPGQPLDKIEIEVYLASSNVEQSNPSPGLETSAFGVDDSTMKWDATTSLNYDVRVREISDASAAPAVILVGVDAEGRTDLTPPGGPTQTTYDQKARHLDWKFVASSKAWQDGGKEPADPDGKDDKGNPAMGQLLVESGNQTLTVVKTDALARSMLTAPAWNGQVKDMTKAATITWTPPTVCHAHGTAKIVSQGGGGGGGGLPGIGPIS